MLTTLFAAFALLHAVDSHLSDGTEFHYSKHLSTHGQAFNITVKGTPGDGPTDAAKELAHEAFIPWLCANIADMESWTVKDGGRPTCEADFAFRLGHGEYLNVAVVIERTA